MQEQSRKLTSFGCYFLCCFIYLSFMTKESFHHAHGIVCHAPRSNNGHSEKFTCVLLKVKGCLLIHFLYLALLIHMSLANILTPRKMK